jgi:small subunit ribosomal protein S13
MVYILNKNFPSNKKLYLALQQIFGIGKFLSLQLNDQIGCTRFTKVQDLTQIQIDKLVRIITQYYLTGSDLKRSINNDIKRLTKIGSYRGIRHQQNLPVRGQRTH